DTSGTLTFHDGEMSETLVIPIQEDTVSEGDENFRVILTNPTSVGLGGVTEAVVTIVDNDAAGQVDFATSALSVSEGDTPILLVTRTGGSRGRISVDYRVTAGTATPQVTGDSTNPDYEDFFGTLTLEDGQTTAEISVHTFDDYVHPVF